MTPARVVLLIASLVALFLSLACAGCGFLFFVFSHAPQPRQYYSVPAYEPAPEPVYAPVWIQPEPREERQLRTLEQPVPAPAPKKRLEVFK